MVKNDEKDFDGWIEVKKKLHNARAIKLINVGDIWWYAAGENIQTEINGKNKGFSRPVIHQLRNINVSRLYSKMGQVPASDLKRIIDGVKNLLDEE